MNDDPLHFAAFLSLFISVYFGGTVVWALLRSRLLLDRGWGASIGSALRWAVLYAIVGTTISDLGAGLIQYHPTVANVIPFTFLALPYFGIAYVLIKYRRSRDHAPANFLPPSEQNSAH